VLANTKLIAEAWDAAGLYQVGSFPNWGRWTEWNGKFRDDVRKFVKGDPGMVSTLATRLCGSADLYQTSNRDPFHSINFITSHDGFTLSDLFSYNNKHNEGNGENGADGGNENYSWNCGKEGPSDSPEINALRNRQTKNIAAILMLSQGTPMMLGGDEIGRTQQGNNNAYCQDNDISWVNWGLLDCHKDLYRFFKRLIGFRKNHPALRRRSFVKDGPDQSPAITWHGVRLNQPDWSWESRSLGMYLNENPDDNDIFFIANAASKRNRFKIPKLDDSRKWFRFVDTSLEMPDDIAEPDREELLTNQGFYNAGARSVVVLIAK
jgi:isoamylase